jgi:NADPH2:quinone reductase
VCRNHSGLAGLALEDIAAPKPRRGELLIEVRTTGINFADLLMIEGRYQARPPLPFVPGIEVSGVVRELGPDVSDIAPGTRVMAYTGIGGGMAELVTAPRTQVFPMPDELDHASAVAMFVSHGTSYHALKDRARLRPGETLLVLGAAGGTGLAAVELGRAMGARVIAAASTSEKRALCLEHGADIVLDYAQVNWRDQARALTGNRGFDVVFDPVGGKHAHALVRCLAFEGRYAVVGFAEGTVPEIPLNIVLLKVASLIGVYWGSFAEKCPERNATNTAELAMLASLGRIRPRISGRYSLTDFRDALQEVADRRVKGKAVLEMPVRKE